MKTFESNKLKKLFIMSIFTGGNETLGAPLGFGGLGYGGGGGGLLGGLLIGALLGNRGGIFGNNTTTPCPGTMEASVTNPLLSATVLSKLGDIQGAIPLSEASLQNAILEQTNALTNLTNQASLANLQASAAVKDSVQNTGTAILLNNNANTQALSAQIGALSSKIDQNTITDLQTQLLRAENEGRARATEVNVSQTVNTVQAQSQLQAQQQQQLQILANLGAAFNNLSGDIQQIKQGQVIFNSGNMAGSGTQAAANTKVA